MQTFLPFSDFLQSAQVLDKKRCWKQVVEAKQIINALQTLNNIFCDSPITNKNIPWINHPAVQMWKGNIPMLKHYFDVFLYHCLEIHHIKTKYEYYTNLSKIDFKSIREFERKLYKEHKPWWLGTEKFHRAMRARLIEKDREFYLPLFPEDEGFNNGLYLWPKMDGSKTFKIIIS